MREVIYDQQGRVLAAYCPSVALSAQARTAITAMAADMRLLMEIDDPDDLLGDKQLRALDRLHRRVTPECGATNGELTCTRPVAHVRHGTRHVTACGTQLWENV